MAKEKMVYFRTSLGGFNKDDVNSYIEKLNAEFSEREKAARKKLEAAEEKISGLEQLQDELKQALDKLSALENAAESREKLIGEQLRRIDEQAAEIEVLTRSKSSAENEAARLAERIESLSETIQKSEKYDDVSAQIGEIILSAKSTAEEIVKQAQNEAARKMREANEQLTGAARNFNARAATAAYAVKNQMRKSAHQSYAALAEQTEKTAALLHTLAENISQSTEAFDDKLSAVKTEAETAVETEAAKLFTEEHKLKF